MDLALNIVTQASVQIALFVPIDDLGTKERVLIENQNSVPTSVTPFFSASARSASDISMACSIESTAASAALCAPAPEPGE